LKATGVLGELLRIQDTRDDFIKTNSVIANTTKFRFFDQQLEINWTFANLKLALEK
jgi:hypothetical protein